VRLDGYSPSENAVVVDLARLLDDVNLMDSEPTDCSSGPAELHCSGPFAALGLDFKNGVALGAQSVFQIRTRN
jgi:hypothetical protein